MKLLMSSILIILVLGLSGCITTNVKGYTDREYNNYKVKSIVVRAPNAGFNFGDLLETSMVNKLKKQGIKAESFLKIFPPTHPWTDGDVAEELIQKGYNSILYINLVGSNSSSQVVGFINNGNARVYGNTGYYNSTSTAIVAMNRNTSTRVKLYDINSGDVIWIGDSSTEARGYAFISDKAQTESISTEVIKVLEKSGHL